MRWRVTRTGVARVLLALACLGESHAYAQHQAEPGTAQRQAVPTAEPVAVLYDAPAAPECPDGAAFFREITARTVRARSAQAGEKARVVHVAIVRNAAASARTAFTGRLMFEDTTQWSSAREVQGATCAEVVEALGLIAALAVDPKASIAPRVAPAAGVGEPPDPGAPAIAQPAAGARPVTLTRPEPVPEQPHPRTPAPVAGGPSRVRLSVGAHAEGATTADVVLSGRLFGELELRDRRRTFAPSVRLAIARSLDVDRRPIIGTATLRWTQASLEGCPVRVAIAESVAVRPCAGATAGALEAESTGVAAGRSRTRPWAALSAHGRFVWEVTSMLALEIEAGALFPLVRETFFFEPQIPVYEAPPVAFFGRGGVVVRFP